MFSSRRFNLRRRNIRDGTPMLLLPLFKSALQLVIIPVKEWPARLVRVPTEWIDVVLGQLPTISRHPFILGRGDDDFTVRSGLRSLPAVRADPGASAES